MKGILAEKSKHILLIRFEKTNKNKVRVFCSYLLYPFPLSSCLCDIRQYPHELWGSFVTFQLHRPPHYPNERFHTHAAQQQILHKTNRRAQQSSICWWKHIQKIQLIVQHSHKLHWESEGCPAYAD